MFDIFILEANPNMQKHLNRSAEQENWYLHVFANAEEASRSILEFPHLWVLDLTCSHDDGWLLFQQIKTQTPEVPVLFLAASADAERIKSLALRDDDFQLAPLNPLELVLRTGRLVKNHYANNQTAVRINLHPYTIDGNRREVILGTDRINLTSKEFNLLLLLIRHRDKVLPRDQVVFEIWGPNARVSERSVDDLVRRLRRKMNALHIETLYGYGYRLISN